MLSMLSTSAGTSVLALNPKSTMHVVMEKKCITSNSLKAANCTLTVPPTAFSIMLQTARLYLNAIPPDTSASSSRNHRCHTVTPSQSRPQSPDGGREPSDQICSAECRGNIASCGRVQSSGLQKSSTECPPHRSLGINNKREPLPTREEARLSTL